MALTRTDIVARIAQVRRLARCGILPLDEARAQLDDLAATLAILDIVES